MSPQPKLARLVIRKTSPEPAKKTAKKRASKTVTPVVQPVVRDTPVHRFVEQLRVKDGVHYLTTAEVASELGVSVGWIHKIQRNPSVQAPSMIARLGKIKVYLYMPADLDEIRRYLVDQQQVYVNPGPDARVESWEEVKKRREQSSTQDADRQDLGDQSEGGDAAEG